MNIEIITSKTDLKQFKLETFFQTQEWVNLFNKQKKYKNISKIFVFEDWIKVYFPSSERNYFWFKLLDNTPLWWYWWFIFNKNKNINNKKKYIIQIIDYLKSIYSYISIVPFYSESDSLLFLKENSFKSTKVFTHILNLNNVDDLKYQLYTKTFRYELKKWLELNIIVKEINTMDYFDLYKENNIKWWKKIYLSKKFFEKLSLNKNVKTIAVYYENIVIGASIFFIYKNEIFYWASHTNDDYKKYYPAKILINNIQEKYINKWYIFNCWSSIWLPWVQKFKESFWAKKIDYNIYSYLSPLLKFILKILWKNQ